MVLKTRSLTSLAAKALVVAVAAGGGMLISGVASADTTGSSPAATPTPAAAPAAATESLLGKLLSGETGSLGNLNPTQLVKPIVDPVLVTVSKATGLDVAKLAGSFLGSPGA